MDMPYNANKVSPSSLHDVLLVLPKYVLLHPVKVQKLDRIIELSSELDGESPNLRLHKTLSSIQSLPNTKARGGSKCNTPSTSLSQSLFSCPLLHPYLVKRVNIMECLRRLVSMHYSQKKLSSIDLTAVKHHCVQFLPLVFNGDVIFELPPYKSSSSSSTTWNLEGMDKRYNIHL